MSRIKVKAPAKINLTLEILDKRPDGYHNLQSIMQAINLYDYLTVEISDFDSERIYIECNKPNIPLDRSNTVYKAVEKYLKKANLTNKLVKIAIEKNIPSQAGLAGGSADAAGVLFALNELFKNTLSMKELDEICSEIGSDVNFCLHGGCALCTSRGEVLEELPTVELPVSIVKPENFGISTPEAYSRFASSSDKSNPNSTLKLKSLILKNEFDKNLLYNSFEKALFPYYPELSEVKEMLPDALMTGSGAAFFVLEKELNVDFDRKEYFVFEGLKTIDTGVETVYYEE